MERADSEPDVGLWLSGRRQCLAPIVSCLLACGLAVVLLPAVAHAQSCGDTRRSECSDCDPDAGGAVSREMCLEEDCEDGDEGPDAEGSPHVRLSSQDGRVKVTDTPIWLSSPRGPALFLKMRYRNGRYATVPGPLGTRWFHNYEIRVQEEGTTSYQLDLGQGRGPRFETTDGTNFADVSAMGLVGRYRKGD